MRLTTYQHAEPHSSDSERTEMLERFHRTQGSADSTNATAPADAQAEHKEFGSYDYLTEHAGIDASYATSKQAEAYHQNHQHGIPQQ
jgi:hypothetical protein